MSSGNFRSWTKWRKYDICKDFIFYIWIIMAFGKYHQKISYFRHFVHERKFSSRNSGSINQINGWKTLARRYQDGGFNYVLHLSGFQVEYRSWNKMMSQKYLQNMWTKRTCPNGMYGRKVKFAITWWNYHQNLWLSKLKKILINVPVSKRVKKICLDNSLKYKEFLSNSGYPL